MNDAAAHLIGSYSIETTPLEKAVPVNLAPRSAVYIAAVPKASREQLIGRVVALRDAGFTPIPHVVARSMESFDALDAFLRQLRGEGVDRALVLGGDTDDIRGPFASSRDILETGL